MGIGVRNTSSVSPAAAGGTLGVTIPSDTLGLDLIFVLFYVEETGTSAPSITVPGGEGYTAYADIENTGTTPDMHQFAFWTRATGSLNTASADANATHTFTLTNISFIGAIVVTMSLAETGGEINDATPITGTGNSTTPTAGDITPVTQPHLEGFAAINFNGSASTPPTGLAEAIDTGGMTFCWVRRTTTAAPGARNSTITSSQWAAAHYLFKEVAKLPAPYIIENAIHRASTY